MAWGGAQPRVFEVYRTIGNRQLRQPGGTVNPILMPIGSTGHVQQ
ncbi:hypothetical protein [Desulfosporosinus sp. Sb-LF]|nr:hypothetical protein [Desulfosporosinus sp. Sb-LF]